MLRLLAKGCTYDEAAHLMGISRNTVMSHIQHAYRKLHVRSKAEAIHEARQLGLDLD